MAGKYEGVQDPALYGGQLHYPGTPDGHPVRHDGPVPPLKPHEIQKISLVQDFKCEMFYTWEPESLARYTELIDRIVNGQFTLKAPRRYIDDPQGRGFAIWVEWCLVYGVLPEA